MAVEDKPTPHPRLKTNALRIRQIKWDEMKWFLGGAFGKAARELGEALNVLTDPKEFYGIVDNKSLYPKLRLTAQWEKTSEADDVMKGLKTLTAQAGRSNSKLGKIVSGIGELAGFAQNSGAPGEFMAAFTGLRYDLVGPATKKIYGKPGMDNVSFTCIYDLRAGQKRIASKMLRTLLDMVYPNDNATGHDEELSLLNSIQSAVNAMQAIFGKHLTYNPLPVEIVLGQHYYMSPAVITGVSISSASDYFEDKDANGDATGRVLPNNITVTIDTSPFILPDPSQSWLVYSGHKLMGDNAGEPYSTSSPH